MILNERQYKITKSQLTKMKKNLFSICDEINNSMKQPKELLDIHKRAIESEIEILEAQLLEYEQIKTGIFNRFEAKSLEELPIILIKARIAKGYSQRELAKKLNLKEQQIQRYEADLYSSTSFKRLIEIAHTLELNISEIAEITDMEKQKSFDWNKFPIKEMYKRNWFEGFRASLDSAIKNKEELLQEYVLSVFPSPQKIFTRKHIRTGSSFDRYSLYAWQCRIANLVLKKKLKTKFKKSNIDDNWLENFIQLSIKDNGPIAVEDYLSSIGISFIIEPHLPHTFLDGAAILLPYNIPVIAMTLRYDRLDNFWFVLIHELAHIIKHFKYGEANCYFDDLESEPDDIEKEADEFTNNILIPSEIWETALARYIRSENAIIDLANEIKRSPAIIAGRIRREANNYTILNNLVGSRCVRKLFSDIVFNY